MCARARARERVGIDGRRQIPRNDGRAGMAAIYGCDARAFQFDALAKLLLKELPRYAVPLFLRFIGGAEVTSTFKVRVVACARSAAADVERAQHLKVDLRKEGYDVTTIKDPLFFFDGKTYVPLTPELHAKINDGSIRV